MKWFVSLALIVFAWSDFSCAQSVAESPKSTGKVTDVSADDFRDVASDLRCPTCTGLSVLDSDAPFSVQIKNEVKDQLAAGKEKTEILRFFTDRYGPWILREPPKEGLNLWAWIIPGSILLLGPILIWYFVWNYRQGSGGIEDGADYEPKPLEEIIRVMHQRLDDLRRKGGGHS
jgi:cytochrome c-type biogenesis protein CcmH